MTAGRILIVDDEPKIRTLLRRCLEGEGYCVTEAGTPAEALQAIAHQPPDLMTLDLQLGAEDGFDLARVIRRTSLAPIIMVTGRDDVIDRVVGLEIGADDYITKPFHVREVTARVKSVLRRTRMAAQPGAGPAPSGDVLEFEGFRLIPDRMQLTNPQGKAVHLTSGDLRLLEAFLAHPKRVLTRDVLMDMTGGATYSPLDRAIDNQIARLRKKLGAGQKTAFPIKTLRGLGYMLACDVKTLAS